MNLRLNDHFDAATLQRGLDYARRGNVVSVEALQGAVLRARVSNGRGQSYQQRITLGNGRVEGVCSCPVGYNCKHVVAALVSWAANEGRRPGLAAPVQGWLSRVRECVPTSQVSQDRSETYPNNVKERLLYLLVPSGTQVKIDIYKGRINTAGTGLNKSIRRYDALRALQSAAPANFLRPVDLELLTTLAQARLWDVSYGYGLPFPLQPKASEAIALMRRLCDTGRFLHDTAPEAHLTWSDECPEARLGWQVAMDGSQRLVFEAEAGKPLQLRGILGSTIWIDTERGQIGSLSQAVDDTVLRLVETSPDVASHEAEALGAALPDTLANMALPRPRQFREARRPAKERVARLTLGAETACDGPRYYGSPILLPTLTLRFVYDGQAVGEDDTEPRLVEDGEVVTLARDHLWEDACAAQLMTAGALPIEEL